MKVRVTAESVLSVDHLGQRWIKPIIVQADQERRKLQDQLFGPSGVQGDRVATWRTQITGVQTTYKAAQDLIQKFHAARVTWEEAADKLPYLAEWAILDASHIADVSQAPPSEPLPDAVRRAFTSLEQLAQELDRRPPKERDEAFTQGVQESFRQLGAATQEAHARLQALEDQFRHRIGDLRSAGVPQRTALDAVLRVPLISADLRANLLRKIHDPDETMMQLAPGEAGPQASQPESPPDRGFWLRATGLAHLDLFLRRVGRDPGADEEKEPGFSELEDAWSKAQPTPPSSEVTESALSSFERVSTAFRRIANNPAERESTRLAAGGLLKKDQVELDLSRKDRAVRLLTAREIENGRSLVDRPVERSQLFARYAALVFHFERLRDDYAAVRYLKGLGNDIQDLEKSLGIDEDETRRLDTPSLRVAVTPEKTLRFEDTAKPQFEIRVEKSGDGAESLASIPGGQAFLGVVVTPSKGLRFEGQAPVNGIIGELVAVPPLVSTHTYYLIQEDLKANTEFNLKTKVFYRGRRGSDGQQGDRRDPEEFPGLGEGFDRPRPQSARAHLRKAGRRTDRGPIPDPPQ